ncbi:MAG: hypothetical protein PVF56_23830 [Desulfobacterales bacterium]|jgi:hypothetical protein
METQLNYSSQVRSPEGKPKRTKPDRRWTLLFIGDHGRVVTLKRFKGYVFLAAVVFLLAAAAIVLLYRHSQNIILDNDKLQSSLDILQKRIKALRHEKEILMARLVLAESRVKESLGAGGRTEDRDKKPSKAVDLKKISDEIKPIEADVIKKKSVVKAPVKDIVASQPSTSNLSVDVEDFNIISMADPTKLKIQFKVKNTSPNSQRVAGHSIVVLNNDPLKPTKWVSIPQMKLVDGKPTGKRHGHAFAINYFRTMRFTANVPPSPDQYTSATVYVFAGNGELLLEKNFPCEIPTAKAATASRSSLDSDQPSQGNVLRDFKNAAARESPQTPQTENQASGSDDPSLSQ